MNTGFVVGNRYIKRVNFSKAVLWMSREISLNPKVVEALKKREIKDVSFEDVIKKEKWIATLEKIMEVATLKQVGQEPQYYIPIEIFKREKFSTN